MKKSSLFKKKLLQARRERKRIKRIRLKSQYKGEFSVYTREQSFRLRADANIVSSFNSDFFNFLVASSFITGQEDDSAIVKIPKAFSLCENYDTSIEAIRNVAYSVWRNLGKEIHLDFSGCIKVDQSALFLLQIIRLELQDDLAKLDRRLSIISSLPKFKIKRSQKQSVNFNLFLCGFLPNVDIMGGIVPLHTLGFIKGTKSQKHYIENRKGIIGTQVVSYLDRCLMDNGYMLTPLGKNDLGNMIGEILNNAEDHSPLNTYYITANYYKDQGQLPSDGGTVGILNLSFMNFGFSIYKGLEETKEKNSEMYNALDQLYRSLGVVSFSRENLFTLYALQDGISRLKFEDESRGTGTMTFINCFYAIGDYENTERELAPQLSILSGTTQLICNNKHRPQKTETGNFLFTLNRENSLQKPPDSENLLSLKHDFPGTILSVRFCLNSSNIQKKVGANGNS